jgi:hypothetical protein
VESYQPLLTEVKHLGLDLEMLDKDLEVVPKRFYCHWMLPGDEIQYDPDHPTIPLVNDKKKRCCFNHHVGLPTRNWEGDQAEPEQIEVELTHYNRRLLEAYHAHRKLSVNKCRGSGMS